MSVWDPTLHGTAVPTRAVAICLWALCLAAPQSLGADSGGLPGGPPERQGSFALGPETGLAVPVRALDGELDAMLVLRVGFNFLL